MATQIKKYKKKDGTTAYMFKKYLGIDQVTGKRQETTRRGFSSLKEAKLALAKLEINFEENGFSPEKRKRTYREVFEEWYKLVYKNRVKESTYWNTLIPFEKHILPALGNLKIDNVSVTFCQKLANNWSREHPKRFKRYLNYAGMVFKYAETLDEIKKNPLERIIIPVVFDDEEAKKNFYSREELLAFLAAYKKLNQPKRYTFFLLLGFTGLRKGEALALTWRDIDFNRKTITINKTLAAGKNGARLIQRPKTKASNGTISIDSTVITALKEWRVRQNSILKRLDHIASTEQLVFSQDEDNSLLYSRTPLTWLQVFYHHHPNIKKITVHGFRHTHASLLFEAGADMKQAQDRLRHTNIKTTMNTYIHVTQEGKDETASLFDDFMANGKRVGQTLGQIKTPLE